MSYILSRKLYNENNSNLQKMFRELDVNKDGHVDIDELYNKYGTLFPGTLDEVWDKIKNFIETVDINKNGKIEYSEFLAVTSMINKEVSQKALKDVFDHYDYNKTGYISSEDLKEIFEDTNISDEEIQRMIDEVDKNGDRQISFDEFYQMIIQAY